MDVFWPCFICCFVGIIIGVLLMRSKPDGIISIDPTAPEEDRYFLKLTIPLEEIVNRKRLEIDVKTLSQFNQRL